jgi:DNA-directed RNA polymerase specialized sigma24 family protein
MTTRQGGRKAAAAVSGGHEMGVDAAGRRVPLGVRGAARSADQDANTGPAPAAGSGSACARRRADEDLVGALAACGFSGPLYDRFRDELARYGISVLCGWMRSGYVFHLAAQRGVGLHPTEQELDEFQRDRDTCQELAIMTVAVALRRFRQQALVEGGWRPDGGASLTTYFMGACLSAFPNEFRRHRLDRRRRQDIGVAELEVTARRLDEEPDPADVTAGNMQVRHVLARADPRTRAIVALWLDGYHHDEIAEMTGEKSARAVEGVLYRWRVKENRRMREGGEPT